MELKILQHLDSKLEERVLELIEFVGHGRASSFDAYKEVCGQIRGLQAAQVEIADLVRRAFDISSAAVTAAQFDIAPLFEPTSNQAGRNEQIAQQPE